MFDCRPQTYIRQTERHSFHEAELRWDDELLELLSRLARDASDTDARRRVGAILRDFLAETGWSAPADDPTEEDDEDEPPAILTISAGAAELYALPWELTTNRANNRHLADARNLLVRYEWPGLPEPRLAEASSLGAPEQAPRIIFAWSAAGGAIPADAHLRAIRRAVNDADPANRTRIEVVENVSGFALDEALSRNRGVTVLHLLCHGAVSGPPDAPSAALVWDAVDGSDGDKERLDADRLARLLAAYRSDLRMVVLCACFGGDSDPAGRYVGSLAQGLHRLGIPAVIASRYPLTPNGSARLARVLYDALLVKGASLERAILSARAGLHNDRGKAHDDDIGDDYGSLSADAYSIQLYARSRRAFLNEKGEPGFQWVTETYPFRRPAEDAAVVKKAPKTKSSLTDAEIEQLLRAIEDARVREELLLASGHPEAAALVREERLRLKRRLREGGQLREGDFLGDTRYLLLKLIGEGGFASVWHAEDTLGERRAVAIKVLRTNLAGDKVRRDRFFRGARIMARMRHPSVVRVLDEEDEDLGFHYFVMEHVNGGDLRSAVLKGRVARSRIVPLILSVGEALAAAHKDGIIHRDVKPANILLDESGAPRLTDFDLVGVRDSTGGTRTGPLGTFIYAAPELMERPQDADERVDVFGLGMTTIFCLFGADLTLSAFRDADAFIEALPCRSSLKHVLKHAVKWPLAERYADMRTFCDALRSVVQEDQLGATPHERVSSEILVFTSYDPPRPPQLTEPSPSPPAAAAPLKMSQFDDITPPRPGHRSPVEPANRVARPPDARAEPPRATSVALQKVPSGGHRAPPRAPPVALPHPPALAGGTSASSNHAPPNDEAPRTPATPVLSAPRRTLWQRVPSWWSWAVGALLVGAGALMGLITPPLDVPSPYVLHGALDCARAAGLLTAAEVALDEGSLDKAEDLSGRASQLVVDGATIAVLRARISIVRADFSWLTEKLLARDDSLGLASARGQLDKDVKEARKRIEEATHVAPRDPVLARLSVDILRIEGSTTIAKNTAASTKDVIDEQDRVFVAATVRMAESDSNWSQIRADLSSSTAGAYLRGRARPMLVYAKARAGDLPAAKDELAKLPAQHQLRKPLDAFLQRLSGGAPTSLKKSNAGNAPRPTVEDTLRKIVERGSGTEEKKLNVAINHKDCRAISSALSSIWQRNHAATTDRLHVYDMHEAYANDPTTPKECADRSTNWLKDHPRTEAIASTSPVPTTRRP